ncbi:unnamed protein product [Moneuplotes crassus]|uniref:Uncharacterized protein n=1 Tax=Euplotes crassus TaxID=5936 RepID=A0AAD1XXH7_EUPCR|nr:unnamed protein product [Moneuplotes crassus]
MEVERAVLQKGRKLQDRVQMDFYMNCTGSEIGVGEGIRVKLSYVGGRKSGWFIRNVLRKGVEIGCVEYLFCNEYVNKGMFKKIMSKPFTKKIEHLTLLFHSSKPESKRIIYRKCFMYLPLVTNRLKISNIEVSTKFLRKVIQVGRHINDIIFMDCKIRCDSLKLSESINYSIHLFKIICSDHSEGQYWSLNFEKLFVILKAFSHTDMKKSLQKFILDIPGFEGDVECWARRLGMNSLKIFIL